MRDAEEITLLRRTVHAERVLQERCDAVGDRVGRKHEDERLPPSPGERQGETEREPDEPVRADLREPDEDLVQRVPAMLDDPSLGAFVPAGQTGAICFVWSISC